MTSLAALLGDVLETMSALKKAVHMFAVGMSRGTNLPELHPTSSAPA